jgi:D-beta-D-heptose 7-phosphate kinase/D-beta-D-heptose 1-phosphate adenosyltransferase
MMTFQVSQLTERVQSFQGKSVLVLGDVMLDRYIWGEVRRISPEAPVPVVTVREETSSPGGAANTAANIVALGGQVSLAGICGDDRAKDILFEALERLDIDTTALQIQKQLPTIEKIRIIGQGQQLLRVDREKNACYSKDVLNHLLHTALAMLNKVDAIVISDYAKGVICTETLPILIEYAANKKIPVLVDPKPKHKSLYRGIYLLTPNAGEALAMAGLEYFDDDSIYLQAAEKLEQELGANILITLGERGMLLHPSPTMNNNSSNSTQLTIPTKAREVFDVSGAGDTVMGTLALAIAAGASLGEAAVLANHAAGVTVAKLGTTTVSPEELLDALHSDPELLHD